MISQIPVYVFEAVVPIQNQMTLVEGPQPGDTEIDHITKVPIILTKRNRTYFLPVGVCLGFMSAFLK